LDENFALNAEQLLNATDEHTKMIFLCTPNNPSGNDLDRDEIIKVINGFQGIVVIDEAYSDFSKQKPFRLDLMKYENIVVLNTFSKAWGCAGIRLGMAFAGSEIIDLFNKVKYPYNINLLTQHQAFDALKRRYDVDKWVGVLMYERNQLAASFKELPFCRKVYPTDANFFLVKVDDADVIYKYLVSCGIIVRNRSRVELCGNCLRITVGTTQENNQLLSALRSYKK
jgi:histidinol-phosphate aminotransferase